MANVRYYTEFRTLRGDFYLLEIWDANHTGDATRAYCDGNGFQLNHDGEVDELFSPIIGSSVTFNLYNQDSAFDTLLSDILTQQDKRFYIKIYRSKYEAGDDLDGWYNTTKVVEDGMVMFATPYEEKTKYYDFFWAGYIVQDLIEEADESKPRLVSFKAADGISLLSTIDYEFGLATTIFTVKNIIIDVLDSAGIGSMFDGTDILLTTVSNWWANEHVYNTSNDPLTLTRMDLKAFTQYTPGADRTYTNALQVIRELCVTFGARFYFDNGSFRFEQIGERDNVNIREFRYLPDGTLYDSESLSLDVSVDQSSVYRSAGTFRHLPAVKTVSLTLDRVSAANIIGGTVTFPADEIDVGVIPSEDNGRIILEMRSRFQTYISTPTAGVATPVFAVTIRLEPSDGSANQYWRNSLVSGVVGFGTGSWSTTLGTYKWAANSVSRQASSSVLTQHSMATGPLPKDGEIFIDITILGFYDAQGSSTSFFSGGNSYVWAVDLERARFENDNNPATNVTATFITSNTSTSLGSAINVNMGSTRIGDGVGAVGSLYVYNGTTWVPSTGWRVGNSGNYVEIAQLSTKQIIGLQTKVVKRFEGTTIQGHNFSDRLLFDTSYWIQLRGTYNANNDEYNGEWFKIAKDTTTTNLENPDIGIDVGVGLDGISDFNGRYLNAGSGLISNMRIDSDNDAIGPFSETATGGKITGSALVTGDTTLEAGLTHDGFLIQEINDVTHSDGSTYNIQDTEYMIFNTWSGGNGTATINLPRAADNEGRLLRFKSDGTISANTSINVVPQSGESVDGNGEFAFDRDYDGIMLLAHNDNWFIIQRKAK